MVTLDELTEQMREIVNHGWHPDPRPPGDGNAGNLLEDLLGVPENALPVADYGIYEIKTHKRGSGAKIKIFSLQPYPRPFSKAPFLEVVGWNDRNHENRRRFSYTKGVSGNSRGFRIQREGNLLSFIHDPRRVERDGYCLPYEDEETYGEYADRVRAHPNFAIELPRYWDIAQTDDNGNENCERRIIDKLQNVLFVERTQRKNPRTRAREFRYHNCWLLSSFRLETFIQYIDNDILNVDFNMHSDHDHGASFRIDRNHLADLFDNSVRII